jgi:thiol-disulfide isomerase/thioredoxin
MRLINRFLFLLLLTSTAAAQGITGFWDGTAKVSDTLTVPVHLELSGSGSNVEGSFINGQQRTPSTEGQVIGDSLTLKFAQYDLTLQATLKNGVLSGTYSKNGGGFSYPLELKPYVEQKSSGVKVPGISGVWIIPTESAKGEHAFRLLITQKGENACATILRVDGDTGTLAGSYRDGKFVLSHFSDIRADILEIAPSPDGSLDLTLIGTHTHVGEENQPAKLTAYRASSAKAKNLPQPDDFSAHTSIKDPEQPFQFSFPDVNGKLVSNNDPQFKNKVVVVNVTGSWCPNCHDEAPFLASLYSKYHARGLEIVALDFEDPSQVKTLTRLRAFIKTYGIDYNYLVAGEQKDIHQKVPQADNLNAWPTTFFIGKDGLVQAVETGFTSPGSAEFDREVKAKYVANIEKLLAERPRTVSKSRQSVSGDQLSRLQNTTEAVDTSGHN